MDEPEGCRMRTVFVQADVQTAVLPDYCEPELPVIHRDMVALERGAFVEMQIR